MSKYNYVQSDNYAVLVRDRKQLIKIDGSTEEISRLDHYAFPSPLVIGQPSIGQVLEVVDFITANCVEQGYEAVVVGTTSTLEDSINMKKVNGKIEFEAQLVIVGLK